VDAVVARDPRHEGPVAGLAEVEGQRGVDRCPVAPREVVEDDDPLAGRPQDLDEDASDIARAPGDEYRHSRPTFPWSFGSESVARSRESSPAAQALDSKAAASGRAEALLQLLDLPLEVPHPLLQLGELGEHRARLEPGPVVDGGIARD